MNANLVVVLVVGLAILASFKARRQGYSRNQRIVLSGIAIGLLIWNLVPNMDQGKAAFVLVGVVTLIAAVWFLRKSG